MPSTIKSPYTSDDNVFPHTLPRHLAHEPATVLPGTRAPCKMRLLIRATPNPVREEEDEMVALDETTEDDVEARAKLVVVPRKRVEQDKLIPG